MKNQVEAGIVELNEGKNKAETAYGNLEPGSEQSRRDMAQGCLALPITGLLSLIAGSLIIALYLIPWPWNGGAIPQLLFCLPWSLWTVVFGVGLLVRARPVDV